MKIQEIARQAAYPTLDRWNDLPLDERRRVSLTEFQADAVAVAVLREVIGQLEARAEREPHAVALGMSVAIDIIAGAVAAPAPADQIISDGPAHRLDLAHGAGLNPRPVAPPTQKPLILPNGDAPPPVISFGGYSTDGATIEFPNGYKFTLTAGRPAQEPETPRPCGDFVRDPKDPAKCGKCGWYTCDKPAAPSPSDVEQAKARVAASIREAVDLTARGGIGYGRVQEMKAEDDLDALIAAVRQEQSQANRESLAARLELCGNDSSSDFFERCADTLRKQAAEIERLKADLDGCQRASEALAKASFTCPTCGPRIAVDEDGCCRSCGADASAIAPPAPFNLGQAWVTKVTSAESNDSPSVIGHANGPSLDALRDFIPQLWGEAVQKWPWLLGQCEPHEWDNRTTTENAIWLIGALCPPAPVAPPPDDASELAAVRQEQAAKPPGRCQDCGERTKDRVNHPTGHLCYKCVRERILADASERAEASQREAFEAGYQAGQLSVDETGLIDGPNQAEAYAAWLTRQDQR